MTRRKELAAAVRRGRGWVWLQRSLCALGIGGAVVCSISMVLVAAGVAGIAASAGSMAAMGSAGANPQTPTGVLGFLIVHGPAITIASMSVVVLALATRRLLAAIPAAGIGVLLYWSMYVQANVAVMYAVIITGVVALVALVAVAAWPNPEPRRR